MPPIEKPDDLQLIANLIRFFSYAGRFLSTMEITKNSLAVILTVSLAADLSDAAFGKRSAVYGHIDENGFLSVDLSELLAKIGRAASPFWKRQLFHTQKVRLSKDKGLKTKI